MSDDSDDDTHEAQAVAVALAAADVTLAVYDALVCYPLPDGAIAEVCAAVARNAREPLERLAFRCFTLGVDRGEALGEARESSAD